MPIYEYQCQICSRIVEDYQKINDPPLTECRNGKCKGKLKRLISQGGFILKGDGWYSTGYQKKTEDPKKTDELKSDKPSKKEKKKKDLKN